MYLCARHTCTLLLFVSALAAALPVAGAKETRNIVVQERETGQFAALDVVNGYAALGDILIGRMLKKAARQYLPHVAGPDHPDLH